MLGPVLGGQCWQPRPLLALPHQLWSTLSPVPATQQVADPLRHQQRSFFGPFRGSDLDAVVEEADAHPNDASKQAQALQLLAEEEPEEAIRRFTSQRYASDDACIKHYIAALVNAGRLESTDLTPILAKYSTASAAAAAVADMPLASMAPRQASFGGKDTGRGSDYSYFNAGSDKQSR
ncbi:uncharacterized protein MONBRDRAFT_24212, partial [Monosiga brevicollis MX1]